MSAQSAEEKARARAAAAALDHLTRGVTLGQVTLAEPRHQGDEEVTGCEVHAARAKPADD